MPYAVHGREPRPRRPAGLARRFACRAAAAGAASRATTRARGVGGDGIERLAAMGSRYGGTGVAGTVQFDEHGDPVDKRFTVGVIQGGEIALPEAGR